MLLYCREPTFQEDLPWQRYVRTGPRKSCGRGSPATCISGLMTSEIIDFLGPLGFDSAWMECEHGPVDWEALGDMTRACDLWGMASITRCNANDAALITRTLDRGSMGIVLPHVNTREEAEAAVGAAKFAPWGIAECSAAGSPSECPTTCTSANDQTMVVVLIEEVTALDNLDDILKVDGVDVFFVAPTDLAQTMGHIGNVGHPEVQSAIDDGIARIVSAGRTAGTLVNDDNVASYVEKGARFLMTSWNAWVARGGAEFLGRIP